MRKNDKRSNRLQRFLAGFLAAVMVLGLVMGSGVTLPVRAAEAETTEEAAPAEKAVSEKAEQIENNDKSEQDDQTDKAGETEQEIKEDEEPAEDETEKEETADEEQKQELESVEEEKAEPEDTDAKEEEAAPEDTDAENAAGEENSIDIPTDTKVVVTTDDPEDSTVTEPGEEPGAVVGMVKGEEAPSLFDRLMAVKSADEFNAILGEYKEEELEAMEAELTKEQGSSLLKKMKELGLLSSTSNSHGNTHAGPILWPSNLLVPVIPKRNTKKLLLKNTRDNANGISVSKVPTKTGDDEYTITLEVYTTGQVTIITEPQPVDIVLVLDTSGSMSETITVGSKNDTSELDTKYGAAEGMYVLHRLLTQCDMRYQNGRWEYKTILSGWQPVESSWTGNDITIRKDNALKIAAQRFVDEVEQKAQDDRVDHRISIVTYGSSASTPLSLTSVNSSANTIRSAIRSVNAIQNTATAIDYGMNNAQAVLDGIPDSRQSGKVVIMFTDGVPTHGSNFDNNVANAAISKSYNMKQDGVTVYSVGVYEGTPSNNVRTFMDYFSSNYKNARSMNNGGQRTGNDYFLTASNAAEITEIFKSIASAIQTPTISLSEETTIKDIVTPQFTMPENTSEIHIYTDESIGGANFANNRQPATDVSVAINGSTVTVNGFDFNENFVSDTAKDGAHDYGRKLIVEFVVQLDPDYLGGTGLATNGPDSGVVDPEGNTVANFEVPHIDVPLKTIEPVAAEWNVYASTEDQLENVFETLQFTIDDGQPVNYTNIFNGVNNAGADVEFDIKDSQGNVVYTYIIQAGATAGSWQNGVLPHLTDQHYTVECTVMDHNNINNTNKADATIDINVFHPIVTFEDKNVYYKGQQIDIENVEPVGDTEWKHGTTSHNDVTMHTTEPTLTFTYSGVSDTTVDQATDYTVSITRVGVEGNDNVNLITDDTVTFLRNCSTVDDLNGASATADEAFKIHVYTPSYAFQDMEAYYGDTVDIDSQKPASTTWKNGDTEAPSQMDNTAPTITIELTPEEGAVNNNGYVAVKEDFNVAAVIKVGNTDITSALISAGMITRICDIEGEDCGDNPEVTTSKAFVVHVKTVTLDVKKEIAGFVADLTKTYDFTVTVTPAQGSGLSSETKSQTLGNNGMLEMAGLPKGASFTVTEKTVPDNYTVTAKVNGETASVTDGAETGAKVVNGTLAADENHVIVTNKLEEIPLTGVNIPVIYLELLIVCGAAIGFVLIALRSRKKREIRNS